MKLVLPLLILVFLAACTTQETHDAPQPVPEQPAENDDTDNAPIDTPPMPPDVSIPDTPLIDNEVESTTHTVEITSSGFEPRELTINEGDTVTWVNNDGPARWPASNRHPVHTDYPGADYTGESYMGSRACMAQGESKEGAFDACMTLEPGVEWSFTFNQAGTWSYHDHRDSTKGGTIEVQ